MVSLVELNKGEDADFIAALGDVFEHSPWLVERTASARPFATRDVLIEALMVAMREAAEEEKLALIRAHPDLAGKAARAGDMTDHSRYEQSSVGLDRLSDDDYDRFTRLNDAYKEKFGFPFIIAVLDHTKDSILAAFEERIESSRESQIDEAINNIGRIVSLRVLNTVTE
ncbi:MAG: 2-oxo-4-hydroxy-4-carboxy-5-ureidoimidazoline decarboxylase [Alphaproteobacteria bacterium]|nr:2-oxo-4-hydroxy-4-carboxy-5-ureidoimidazoline decarboxylase [Alphaproteobacteria bacterium]